MHLLVQVLTDSERKESRNFNVVSSVTMVKEQ